MAVVIQKEYATAGAKAIEDTGVVCKTVQNVVSIASGDSSGSIYAIARVPAQAIPVVGKAKLYTSGVASVTDADLGLYAEELDGTLTVKEVDIFSDGQTLASAIAPTSGADALKSLAIGDVNKTVATLASDVAGEHQVYVVALTLNAAATGAGTVGVTMDFAYGA